MENSSDLQSLAKKVSPISELEFFMGISTLCLIENAAFVA